MNKNEYLAMVSKLHTSVNEEDILLKKKHTGRPRAAALIAAAVLLLALAAGAAAAHGRRVQELVLRGGDAPERELSEAQPEQTDELPDKTEQSEAYDPLPEGKDMISLQGYAGSPEYQAALEWAEFEHAYDRDGEILRKVGSDTTPWDGKYGYNGYYVYSREMADKLEDIAARYALALHTGGLQVTSVAGLEERFGDFLAAEQWGGYCYEDGTFQSDCTQDGFDFQIRRCAKGVLDIVTLNMEDAARYEQWEYTADCGETVLLALGPEKALIFADLESSFVAVNILAGTDTGKSITARELEAFADSIDFSLL